MRFRGVSFFLSALALLAACRESAGPSAASRGLDGSRFFAARAKAEGWPVLAMIMNLAQAPARPENARIANAGELENHTVMGLWIHGSR